MPIPDGAPDPLPHVSPTEISWRDRTLTYFGGCDYFRLGHHAEVRAAARAMLEGPGGMSTAASRLTTGNHELYAQLESELAGFFKVPDAVVVSSGYVSNLAVAQGVVDMFDAILLDERAHGSLVDAARWTGLPMVRFKQGDSADVAGLIATSGRTLGLPEGRSTRWVLLTDGMYAQDGGIAPLASYRKALPLDAWLWVDDAHGGGTIGRRGGGSVEVERVARRQCIQTGTLSKAFGVYGGFILAPRPVLEAVRRQSALYVGNTPLPPVLAAAACVSVGLLGEHPEWRSRMEESCGLLRPAFRALATRTGTRTTSGQRADVKEARERGRVRKVWGPVMSWSPPDAAAAACFGEILLGNGIYPSCIKYPGGAVGGFYRFAISSSHSREEVDRLVLACRQMRGEFEE